MRETETTTDKDMIQEAYHHKIMVNNIINFNVGAVKPSTIICDFNVSVSTENFAGAQRIFFHLNLEVANMILNFLNFFAT